MDENHLGPQIGDWRSRSAEDVVVLIDRWLAMKGELPDDPEQVLRDLRDCIKGEGPYARG